MQTRIVRNECELVQTLELFEYAPVVYLDTETTGLDPRASQLLMVQIGTEDHVFVFDFTRIPIKALRHFEGVLTSPQTVKVIHNASFDLKVFYHFGGYMVGPVHDTRFAEVLLKSGIENRYDLASVANRRLGVTLDKTVRDSFIGQTIADLSDEQILYAATDVVVLPSIYQQQMTEIHEADLDQVCRLEMDLVPVVAKMEYVGMPFKKQHLQDIEPVLDRLIVEAEQGMQDALIGAGVVEQIVFTKDGYTAVNTSSNQQMLAMFNALGIDVPDLNARTVTEWDYRNRKSASKYVPDPELLEDELLESVDAYGRYDNFYLRMHAYLGGARKLQSTYVQGLQTMQSPITGRIHATFTQIGAATGRFSSSRPNLQNLPSDQKMKNLGLEQSIRHAFAVNAETHRMIIADYSTIELVIIADASGDEVLDSHLDDLHTFVAQQILGVKDINNKNKKEHPYKIWRDVAKMVNYSIAYSVGGESLAKQMTIQLAPLNVKFTAKQADEIIEAWKALFPQATAWLKKSARSAVVYGWVADSFGRRRYWNRDEFVQKWKKEAAEREAMNFPIQALSASMVKLALVDAYRRLDETQASIISTVHDEIILESTIAYAETARDILKDSMEKAALQVLPRLGPSVIVDPAISTRYDK
jgi:DNA polymerase-1